MPVHGGGDAFGRCLAHLTRLDPAPHEIIVVEDGEPWNGQPYPPQVQVIGQLRRSGPAAARNRGAERASGDVLFFVDADVLVPPSALATLAAALDDRAIDAVIGSYDRHPAAPNFVSQFKNLAHRFVHQHAREDGVSFWGACGAIRRPAFQALGGFDEAFDTPSIEDIELGARLRRRGGRIRVRRDLEVTHLKRWTFGSLLRTDVYQRALPWSTLLLREGRMPDDLNVTRRARLAVAATFALLACAPLVMLVPPAAWLMAALAVVLVLVDWRLWRYFAAERGWLFALRAVPMQWLYYTYSGAAFAWIWLTGDWRTARAAARLRELV